MSDQQVLGKIGRVTAALVPGKIGEVMIAVRGGSEAFLARSDGDNVIPAGSRVVVVEYHPPRSVVVELIP
jgi:membrane protein implicated in regulation of membrane protease activity